MAIISCWSESVCALGVVGAGTRPVRSKDTPNTSTASAPADAARAGQTELRVAAMRWRMAACCRCQNHSGCCVLERCQTGWRRVVARAVEAGVPRPAFTTALAFYDGYRSARLPANLLQAQRDFFGAHTYERVDKPRGQFFHTNWTGHGGRVASGVYNA